MSGATLNAAHSVVKVVGAILWFVGFIFLFIATPFGLLILVVALILSILSLTWTRQARHDELVDATSTSTQVSTSAAPAAPAPSAADEFATAHERLQGLQQLHDDGLITDGEYDQKRKDIVDEM
jgi:hypothetical protein